MQHYLFRRFRDATQREMMTSAIITAIVVTGLGVLASYIYVHTVDQQLYRDYEAAKALQLRNTSAYIHNKFVSYQQVLLAGATAVNIRGAENLTRTDWKLHYDTNHVQSNFPGILGLSFARHIPAEDVASVTETIRGEGFPDFSIYPTGTRDDYTAIIFIEPFNSINKKAFGYDMFSEPLRHDAMVRARDTGGFALTAPLTLRQDDTDQNSKNGLLYYPVYATDSTSTTAAERRDNLKGYVYIAFQVQKMMQDREMELAGSGITYTIHDVTQGKPQHMYAFTRGTTAPGDSVSGEIKVGLRTWRLTLHVPRATGNAHVKILLLLLAGIVASIILGTLVYSFLRNRIAKIHNRHEVELQSTKDELLALASHQLRTPASGVRQYLGMLKQGYFGDLSADQLAIAEKAYGANDRQLEIIDQLLYVAKADAGQLILQPEVLNLSKVIKSTIEDMTSTATHKGITIHAVLPKKLMITADERLLRMIAENLVSNAIKYSYHDSAITVRLTTSQGFVKLSVRDKGVGIAESDQDQLFKKFSRIQNPLSAKEGGSGLGLYLAERLAEAHGGSIGVTTEQGKGSRFTLVLPKQGGAENNVIQITE